MADINPPTREEHILEEPRKLPDMLNVLTILTFIGCGLAFLSSVIAFATAKKIYDISMEGLQHADQVPSMFRGLQGPDPMGVAQRTYDNRVPIFVLNIVATTLCLIGAIQMRKFKRTGFYIYLVGEILPMIIIFIFIGSAALSGFRLVGSVLFLAVFLILYGTQVKYLKD
jgi:hypothetical protein